MRTAFQAHDLKDEPMAQCIALLRGINVGRAKRIAMADLRALMEELGFRNVKTLLNSGNVVFDATRPNPKRIAKTIEAAIEERCGFTAAVIVMTAADLHAAIAANPIPQAEKDPSQFLLGFTQDPAAIEPVRPLAKQDWKPDMLAVSDKAVYMWCRAGILQSKVPEALMRLKGLSVTTRNWATAMKLREMTSTD